jgi:hypothetical protein
MLEDRCGKSVRTSTRPGNYAFIGIGHHQNSVRQIST